MTKKRTPKLRVDIAEKMRARHGLPDPEPKGSGTARSQPHVDAGADLTEQDWRHIAASDRRAGEARRALVAAENQRDLPQPQPQPEPAPAGKLRVDFAANMRRLMAERGWT